jgi:hypothetical protein
LLRISRHHALPDGHASELVLHPHHLYHWSNPTQRALQHRSGLEPQEEQLKPHHLYDWSISICAFRYVLNVHH